MDRFKRHEIFMLILQRVIRYISYEIFKKFLFRNVKLKIFCKRGKRVHITEDYSIFNFFNKAQDLLTTVLLLQNFIENIYCKH